VQRLVTEKNKRTALSQDRGLVIRTSVMAQPPICTTCFYFRGYLAKGLAITPLLARPIPRPRGRALRHALTRLIRGKLEPRAEREVCELPISGGLVDLANNALASLDAQAQFDRSIK